MRDTVAQLRPDLLELAVQVVGEDPFVRAEQGTRFSQPAIFCASIAGFSALDEDTKQGAEYVAGHSLGELGALVAAGVLSERDGLELVTLRGRLMQEAGDTAGDGGMMALLGADAAELAAEVAEPHGLSIANDNSPQQVVLSGLRSALPGAEQTAKELGLRAMILPVTGAFHSPLMASAVPAFESALAEVAFAEPRITAISAVTAEPFDDVRARLAQALTGPVRWRELLLALHARGVQRSGQAHAQGCGVSQCLK
jgi:malonyl CoA-acyl carrier protein transacylase